MKRRAKPTTRVQKVPVIATWDDEDVKNYLEDKKQAIERDVRPLLYVKGHAPFAICREVFSYVDHLGHLYTGKGDNKVWERFRNYLRDMMSSGESDYGKRADQIYQMYRNGPVHEFEPKVLENDRGQLLAWFCYPGERQKCWVSNAGVDVTHLELKPMGNLGFWLPVSTKCLIDDLCTSIDKFAGHEAKDERVCAWNRAARELNTPRPWTDRSF